MPAILNYLALAKRRLLIFGLLPALAGLAVGVWGSVRAADASAFLENLREVEGQVIRVLPSDGNLVIDVEYLDEAGVRYERQFSVDSRMETSLRSVGKLSLIFDARNPAYVEIGHVVSASNQQKLDLAMAAGGFLLCGYGVFFAVARARDAAKTLALFRTGTLVRTEVRDSALAPGAAVGRFTYAFRGPDGRWYEGKSPELPAARLVQWPVGRKLLVAYHPANPRRAEADIFGEIDEKRREALLAPNDPN